MISLSSIFSSFRNFSASFSVAGSSGEALRRGEGRAARAARRGLDFPFGRSPYAPSSSRSSGGDKKGGAAVIVVIVIALAIIAISWGASILIKLAISRSREFMADAGSVELTKDPDAMISALRKIEGHAAIEDMPSRMQAFFIETPAMREVSSVFATHPPIAARIDALVRFAAGRDLNTPRAETNA